MKTKENSLDAQKQGAVGEPMGVSFNRNVCVDRLNSAFMKLLQKIFFLCLFCNISFSKDIQMDEKFSSKKFAENILKFQSLGREKTLLFFEDVLRSEKYNQKEDFVLSENLYYYLRVLFEIERCDGLFGMGYPIMDEATKNEIATFPILFIDDYPLLLVQHYILGGIVDLKGGNRKILDDAKGRKMIFRKINQNPNVSLFVKNKYFIKYKDDLFFYLLFKKYGLK